MNSTCIDCIERIDSSTSYARMVDLSNNETSAKRLRFLNSDSTQPVRGLFPQRTLSIGILNSFRNLAHNWDGYNAPPIEDEVINTSLAVLDKLTLEPEIFPTGRNSVQFEYDSNNGNYIEIEIFSDYIHLVYEQNGVLSELDLGLRQLDELDRIIHRIIEA